MSKKVKIGLSVSMLLVIVFAFYIANINNNNDDDITSSAVSGEEFSDNDNVSLPDEKEESNDELSIEKKERAIESKKPQSKITIKPLKDTSSGKEFYELDDAPLQYVIDGVDFRLNDNVNKTSPTIELTEEDINRIQSNGYDWHTGYVERYEPRFKYGEYYDKYPEYTNIILEEYVPQRLDIYKNAMVGWVTDPNLVYQNAMGFYSVSGVLQISYVNEENPFKLKAEKIYERDTEFRYSNTTDGLSLVQVIYLSDWREIKE